VAHLTIGYETRRPWTRPVRAEKPVQGSDQQDCRPGRLAVMITGHVPAVRFSPDHAGGLLAAACTASKLIALCLTWGSYDQLRRLVVLVDNAVEHLAPLDWQVQRRAGLAVLVGRPLLAGLVRAVPVVVAGVLAED
jgi:hypothetical protein